jgi:hypothetical protein
MGKHECVWTLVERPEAFNLFTLTRRREVSPCWGRYQSLAIAQRDPRAHELLRG